MAELLCLAMGLTPVMGGSGRRWPVRADMGGEKPPTAARGEPKQSKGEGLRCEVQRPCVTAMGVPADVGWQLVSGGLGRERGGGEGEREQGRSGLRQRRKSKAVRKDLS